MIGRKGRFKVNPLIGVTSTLKDVDYYGYQIHCSVLPEFYVHAVTSVGGIPFPLTPSKNLEPDSYLDNVKGLILSGGADVAPSFYNSQPHKSTKPPSFLQDRFEIKIAKLALETDIPVLAVCRGMQLLNVAAGGTLIQDIKDLLNSPINHDQKNLEDYQPAHSINLLGEGKLKNIFRKNELDVNSFHHQAIDGVAPGFKVTARAPDGVIEGIESLEHHWAVGVQWHPEMMLGWKEEQKHLFKAFVSQR